MIDVESLAKKAKIASRKLALCTTDEKNRALELIAECVQLNRDAILTANEEDVAEARKNGLSDALIDRLLLTSERLTANINDLLRVIELPDPVGEVIEEGVLPNGLAFQKQRVPLGVLAVIYEARPNVTLDVASLALKSGNAVVLRGGSETIRTNSAMARAMREGLKKSTLPYEAVQMITETDRGLVLKLLQLDTWIDMVIPRGGATLHAFCKQNSRIPVITGGIGICHLFVDESADLQASIEVIRNAKVQRPSVCNALDTVLVHEGIAEPFLIDLVNRLKEDGVSFRADEKAYSILGNLGADVRIAGTDDFDTEWLSLVLGLRVVKNMDEAIEHIYLHSTGHSDGILSNNSQNTTRFIQEVDSAVVYVNASTRFTDGAQLGLGAEVAVSTQRLHARGPMALRELTTYKWVVRGNYHIRK
ncbi:glutamate-5-semialdehyde dehydrogenase [Anaerolinea thermolimosa]|uniref:glutamate-5-semialdehyde dehydrogenase n=1 Tax=Anaerolinea thermolimosa TaxID=229919 RepID=UPI0007815360|nr:glutamate-5-semialdehyde dehydrogenase [Anaerolinea thermolimosa]GAP06324.1 glutamate-5-semialdehyde dehydrogenase [Anaerolinea thermolimosa]